MVKIQEALNYQEIIKEYPWVLGKGGNCILSPDSDGFLCGLLTTNYLNSKIVGYYDAKILIIKKGVEPKNCIFFDSDINRTHIRSIGHHMVIYNKNISNPNFNYSNCIQPNIMRNFDGRQDFQRKYPFGTIHLLLGLFKTAGILDKVPTSAIWPLLFTDGVWNNLFGYTENCIDWINYLGINSKKHILNYLFCSNDQSFFEIMLGLNKFLRMRDSFNAKGFYFAGKYNLGGRNKRTGHQLKITNSKGDPLNLIKMGNSFKIHDEEKNRVEGFISSMGKYLNWNYFTTNWNWDNFRVFKFSKGDFSKSKKLNNKTFLKLMNKNPLSLAMTSGQNIEYTLEKPDKL